MWPMGLLFSFSKLKSKLSFSDNLLSNLYTDEGWEDLGNSESSSCDEETVEQEEEEAMEQETIDLFVSV